MYEYIKWIIAAIGAALVIVGFLLTIHLKTEPSNELFGLDNLTYPYETKGWVMFFSGIAIILIDILLHET